jgi:putative transcriptional regulator
MKELRENIGITQEQLANKAGVRRETIVFMEAGRYSPSLRLAFKVAKALRSTIEEVFILP